MHPFTRRMTSNFNAKLYPMDTPTHTFEIFVAILQHCDTIATVVSHNCHTVAQAQHCCIIVTVMYKQQCCKFVTPLDVHVLFSCRICLVPLLFSWSSFVPLLFSWSSFVPLLFSTLDKPGTKRERDPPSGGQLLYSPVRSFRGTF